MPTDEAPAKLTLFNIKHVHYSVVGACCKPRGVLRESDVVHREEVVLEFHLNIICHLVRVLGGLELYRPVSMSRCNQ